MIGVTEILLLFYVVLFPTPSHSSAYSPSPGPRSLTKLDSSLKFCKHIEISCCASVEDLKLQKEFQAMSIIDPDCACIIKSILCSRCDQFSADLFQTDFGLKNIPALCDSIDAMYGAATDICTKVRKKCADILVFNSRFIPSLKNKSSTSFDPISSKLKDQRQSKSSFCETFDKSSQCFNGTTASFSTFCETFDKSSQCFNGTTASFSTSKASSNSPTGLCLEKISNGSYINVVPHPDGSNRVFMSNQQGQIWFATVPEVGSTKVLGIDDSILFVDLSDQVLDGAEFGVMGMAFHPDFARNGRFFVSFNCDKLQQPGCQGRCSCNTDVSCDPAKLKTDNGVEPCQYHSAIGEFTANSTASKNSLGQSANPVEVRRIFTIGLPYKGGHAGQILFGPADGYLYFMTGDGSHRDDPHNFAQNKKSLLGKILRLDIDTVPSLAEVRRQGRWGNYSIPKDNPHYTDKELEPEIWALGLRNPWRCSFDSERPSYFLCGDCGQDQYEEIDLIKKGGNYGWRVYEGSYPFNTSISQGRYITSPSSINPIFPVTGYNHTNTDHKNGAASITGGYFYRSATDPCMNGRYLYTDLYSYDIWAATESPENSGNFTSSSIPFSCAHDSPIQCSMKPGGGGSPALGYVFSLAEDNKKDVYFLTSSGVYRVARPSRCNYKCFKETVTTTKGNRSDSSADRSGNLNNEDFSTCYVYFILMIYLNVVGFL